MHPITEDHTRYDAWNRLVQVTDPAGQVIAKYSYNAMGYRISESYPQGGNGIAAGTVKYLYYSNNWQVLETRWNGTANTDVAHQYVWSQMYIDAMVLRDTYADGAIQPEARVYVQYDANFNTTALVSFSNGLWGIGQRYTYTPYGVPTLRDGNFAPTSAGTPWQYMHQGGRQDPITGLYLFRHRDYSPTLGNWIEQDPAGYINGGNTYATDGGAPAVALDAIGLWKVTRSGGPYATAISRAGDTIMGLAEYVGLRVKQWRNWLTVMKALRTVNGGALNYRAPLCPKQLVRIPNLVMAQWSGELGGVGRFLIGWGNDLSTLRRRGYDVLTLRNPTANQDYLDFATYTASRQLQGFFFWGHGFTDHTGLLTDAHPPGKYKTIVVGHNQKGRPLTGRQRVKGVESKYELYYSQASASLNYNLGLVITFACYSDRAPSAIGSPNSAGFVQWSSRGELIPVPGLNPQSMSTIVPPGVQGTNK